MTLPDWRGVMRRRGLPTIPRKCPYCGFRARGHLAVLKHAARVHFGKEYDDTCPACGKRRLSCRQMVLHLYDAHPDLFRT